MDEVLIMRTRRKRDPGTSERRDERAPSRRVRRRAASNTQPLRGVSFGVATGSGLRVA